MQNQDLTYEERNRIQADELEKRLEQETLPPANIIVAGVTGSGKSTLLNAVFGEEVAKTGTGRPVTDSMNVYENDDVPVRIWDTVGLELDAEKTRKTIEGIKKVIAEKVSDDDLFDRVHAIWYCISSSGNRYQGPELNFIKELHSIGVPFIIVLTKCYGDTEVIDEFEKQIQEINKREGLDDVEVVRVLAKEFKVKAGGTEFIVPAFGLLDLVDKTTNKLPDFIKDGFIAAQRVDKARKREKCEEVIYIFTKAAQVGFWDQVPIANLFSTQSKIKNMLARIGAIYNTVLSDESLGEIMNQRLDWYNRFWGLIAPIDFKGYRKNIVDLLESKKNEGFNVRVADIPQNYRAARMVAFYGYTFVDSIEQVWSKLTETQLKDVEMVVNQLVGEINKRLRAREQAIEERQNEKEE